MILLHPLAGSHITLRSLTAGDITQTYVAWLNDPEVNRYLEIRHRRHDTASVAAFVDAMNASPDQLLLGIFVEGRRHIGNVKLGPINAIHGHADISLFLGDRAHWNKGYGREAVSLLLRYGFETLHLHKVCAGIYAGNASSLSLFQSAGFSREGHLREHCLDADGHRTDVFRLALLAKDVIGANP